MPKLTKKELPYLAIKTKNGETIHEVDGNTEVGGGFPVEIGFEDEDTVYINDENGNQLGQIRFPKDCLVILENVPED